MPIPIDFYFDFSSPYSAIAAHKLINGLLPAEADIRWTPILIGAIFKQIGREMPSPARMQYMMCDCERAATIFGFPLRWPSRFPINGLHASRAFYAVQQHDAAAAIRLAYALFKAYWTEDRDISEVSVVSAIATQCGLDPIHITAQLAEQTAKDTLRHATQTAAIRGVFGVPYFFLGDEPFWGADRLEHIAFKLRS